MKKNKKQLKRIIAFLMVLALVLSSITLDRHATQAADVSAKIILNFDKVYTDNTYDVTVTKQGETTPVYDKEIKLSDVATASDAPTEFSQLTLADIKLAADATYDVVARLKQNNGNLVTQAVASLKASSTKNEYKVSMSKFVSSWKQITIKLNGTYKDVSYTIGNITKTVSGDSVENFNISESSELDLTVGQEIKVTGTYVGKDTVKNGLEYSGKATIVNSSSDVSVDLTSDTGRYFRLESCSVSGADILIKNKDAGEDAYGLLTADRILEKDTEYTVKIVGKNDYNILTVTGLNNGTYAPTSTAGAWKDTYAWTGTLNNKSAITVIAKKAKLTVTTSTDALNCVPGVAATLNYTLGIEDHDARYTVPDDVNVTIKKNDNSQFKLDYDTAKKSCDITVDYLDKKDNSSDSETQDAGLVILSTDDTRFEPFANKSVAVKAEVLNIMPGTDFKIAGLKNPYYAGDRKFYYRTADGVTPAITLLKGKYTHYEYTFKVKDDKGNITYTTGSGDIKDDVNIKIPSDATEMKLKMSGAKYGAGTLTLVLDNEAPILYDGSQNEVSGTVSGTYYRNSDEYFVTMENVLKQVLSGYSTSDNGSGIDSFEVMLESNNADSNGIPVNEYRFTANNSCRGKKYTVRLKDKVGNIKTYDFILTVDMTDVTVTYELYSGEDKLTKIAGNYYINNSDNEIRVKASAESWTLYKSISGDPWLQMLGTDDFKNPKPIFNFELKDANSKAVKFEPNQLSTEIDKCSMENGGKMHWEETWIISADALKDGEYTLGVGTWRKENPINVLNPSQCTVVIDNTAPAEDEAYAYASPVSVKNSYTNEMDAFADYATEITAYNKNSKLNWAYKDVNPSKAVMKLNGTEYVLGENDMAEGSPAFGDLEKKEIAGAANASVIFTDKAQNSTEIPLVRGAANAEDNGDAENIYYIINPVTFGKLTASTTGEGFTDKTTKETDNILSISQENGKKYINGSIALNKDNEGTIRSEFLAIYAVKDNETIEIFNGIEDENSKVAIDEKDKKITFKTDVTDWAEGSYVFNAYYYDIAAEQVTKVSSGNYIYDITAPKLSSNYDEKTGTLIYTLIDNNPYFNGFEVAASASNNDGTISGDRLTLNGSKVESINELIGKLKTKDGWKAGKDGEYTATIKFNVEGKYNVSITPIDRAKWTAKTVSDKVSYDVTAPELTSYRVKTGNTTSNKNYSQFDKSKAIVEVELKEMVSKDVTLTCSLHNDDTDKDSTISLNKKLKQYKSTFTGSFEISANFKGTIKFDTADGNKNTTSKSIKFKNGIVIENNKMHEKTSDVKITDMNPSDARNDIYNENVKLSFAVQDTYSGIQSIKYSLNGVEKTVKLNQSGKIVEKWNGSDHIAATHMNEGDKVPVVITVTDNAGHVTKKEKKYKIDVTDPEISVAYDNNAPQNEKYYNKTRTATITIKEHNFDNKGVVFSVKRNGSNVAVTPNFHYVSKDTYAMNYAFAEDGDYEFTLECTDLAGNKSNYKKVDTFTVDQTKPVMTISYDNNKANAGNYYGEARTATITVTEHNFDPNGIKVTVTASKNGTSIGAPTVSGFSTNGDVHTATIHFGADADYTISATSTDLAGNVGEDIPQQSFTVDLTAPEISIEGVTNNTSYTGTVTPTVKVTDTNYNADGVTLTLVGGMTGTKNVSYGTTTVANGQNFAFNDLAHTQEMDDCYVLTAVAVDKAGHETKETIAYRVNRFGSRYVMNEDLEKAVESYYTAASDKFAITEQNVDELKTYSVTYTVDNDIKELEEGTDFTVTKKDNNNGWKEYVYNLSKDSFDKEGIYTISVASEDKADNLSDNKSKGVNMEFCIDNTAPVCVVSGVEDGQRFKKDDVANIGIEVYDNIKFATMKVELNGQEIKTESDLQDGKLSLPVSPTSGEQVLKVSCYDAAGNEKIEEIHFSFDVNILQSHLWVVIVIIGICIVLLGFVIVILAKKRKANR